VFLFGFRANRPARLHRSKPWPTPAPPNGAPYAIPALAFKDIWVDPVAGLDSNTGASAAAALKTFAKAWAAVPRGVALAQPMRIRLMNGTVPDAGVPELWESRCVAAGPPARQLWAVRWCCGWRWRWVT
jgi:hypothetical protein